MRRVSLSYWTKSGLLVGVCALLFMCFYQPSWVQASTTRSIPSRMGLVAAAVGSFDPVPVRYTGPGGVIHAQFSGSGVEVSPTYQSWWYGGCSGAGYNTYVTRMLDSTTNSYVYSLYLQYRGDYSDWVTAPSANNITTSVTRGGRIGRDTVYAELIVDQASPRHSGAQLLISSCKGYLGVPGDPDPNLAYSNAYAQVIFDTPNSPPARPAVVGISSGGTETTYTYTFSGAVDPDGDTIRYGVDIDNDGVVNDLVPSGGGYLPSGSSAIYTHSWTGAGAQPFQVRAQDSGGNSSSWVVVEPSAPLISGPTTGGPNVVYTYVFSATTTPHSKTMFLTSGTSWTVPSDWNSADNTIEAIGGGAGGDAYSAGGGGAYSKSTNVPLTPGATVTYKVGGGGASGIYGGSGVGGDTYFCTSTSNCASIAGSAVVVGAKGGYYSGGGSTVGGVGTPKYSGGSGAGGIEYYYSDGTGGIEYYGSGGGGAGKPTGNGVSGTPGTDLAGTGVGGAGSGVLWTQTSNGATAGAGAGGDGQHDYPEFVYAENGELYGGGGGSSDGYGPGGSGAQGIIVITYTPTVSQLRYGIDWDNSGTVDEWAPASGYLASGVSGGTTHSWASSGTYPFKVLAQDSSGNNSAWTTRTMTVGSQPPTVVLLASTTAFRQGDPSVGLTWSTSDTTSCTPTNFPTGGTLNGSTSVTPSADTTYTLSCTGPAGSASDSKTITYTANQAPATTLSGPTTGQVGYQYTFTTTGTDPEGDQVTPGIDWNNDDIIDNYLPATSTLSNSATPLTKTYFWTTPGSYTLKARSVDSRGSLGPWSPTLSITISPSCVSCTPLLGYAWSDTTGWISLNCLNDASCGTSNYGLQFDQVGNLSGYAWSDNVGWISANSADLVSCPYSSCSAKINNQSLNLEGWTKVVSTQGWNGWISLNCLNDGTCASSSYAPLLNTTTHAFSGYAWEPEAMGWIKFDNAYTAYTPLVANTNQCLSSTISRHINADLSYTDTTCTFAAQGYACDYPSGVCLWPPPPTTADPVNYPTGLKLKPSYVRAGSTIQVIWSIQNANPATCTVTGTNGDSWSGSAGNTPAGVTSGTISQQTTYTLTCHGAINSTQVYTTKAVVNILPGYRER